MLSFGTLRSLRTEGQHPKEMNYDATFEVVASEFISDEKPQRPNIKP